MGRKKSDWLSFFRRIPFPKFSSGFILIELLVVIAVIGALSAGAINVINPPGNIAKTHDAQRKNDLIQIRTALDTYYSDYNKYPAANEYPAKLTDSSTGQVYISKLPKDPLSPKQDYCYESNGTSFRLSAKLERRDDPQITGSVACAGDSVSGSTYNYSLTSTNTSSFAFNVTPTPAPVLPTSTPISTPTSTPISTPTSTPTSTITPTPTPVDCRPPCSPGYILVSGACIPDPRAVTACEEKNEYDYCNPNGQCRNGVCIPTFIAPKWSLTVPSGVTVSPSTSCFNDNDLVTLTYPEAVRWRKNGVAMEGTYGNPYTAGDVVKTVTWNIRESVVITIEKNPKQIWRVTGAGPYLNISGRGIVVDPTVNYVTVEDGTEVTIGVWASPMEWHINGQPMFKATKDNCGRWAFHNPIKLTITGHTSVSYARFDPNVYGYRPNYSFVTRGYIGLKNWSPDNMDWTAFIDPIEGENGVVINYPGEDFAGGGCPDDVWTFTAPVVPAYWLVNGAKMHEGKQSFTQKLGYGLNVSYIPTSPFKFSVMVNRSEDDEVLVTGATLIKSYWSCGYSGFGYGTYTSWAEVKADSRCYQYGLHLGVTVHKNYQTKWLDNVTVSVPSLNKRTYNMGGGNSYAPAGQFYGDVLATTYNGGTNNTKICWRSSGLRTCSFSVSFRAGEYGAIEFR